MKYFAYGSNMNLMDLDEWCEKKNHSPVSPISTTNGYIVGYSLSFSHYSKDRKGGTLNLVKASLNDKVCGVVFDLTEEDFKKIIAKEGEEYKCFSTNVYLSEGKVVGAKTFRDKNNKILYAPTPCYVNIVLGGAEQFNLGKECKEKIEKAAQYAKDSAR